MNPLTEIIRAEIGKSGAIPFHRFMELALYCPEYGFYEKEKDTVGRRGDFYTSVSVGPLFGRMLAFQFFEWRKELRIADCGLRIVEAGAHDGKLAADVLGWIREKRPEVFRELQYVIIEPSALRRAWQAETLRTFGNSVSWINDPSALNPQSAIRDPQFTIVFSNELLDAFPVHRFGWDANAKRWFEWGVSEGAGKFTWTRLPLAHGAPSAELSITPELEAVLPDEFTIETCPAAEEWWRTEAARLGCGKLLTFDYGFTAGEWLRPERTRGTLRAYHQHRVTDDLLANPGEQDITAHVNFSALQSAGESAGLKTEMLVSQASFLTPIAARVWKEPGAFGDWTPADTRQFQTLTHPEHLGRSFRVLVQCSKRDSRE